jgi:sortase A
LTAVALPQRTPEVVDIRPDQQRLESPNRQTKRNPRRIVGSALIGLGCVIALFLVYEFGLSRLTYERSQTLLMRDLQDLVASKEATALEWVPTEGQPVGVMSIPKIGLTSVIVQGTSPTLTGEGPGHLRGTPLPGRPGNSVILGRRTTFGAPFKRLNELLPGDEVSVSTGAGRFTYLVATVNAIRPGDPDVLASTPDNRLTLITSSPPYLATGRYVVTAVLKGLPASQPVAPESYVAPSELGLAGEAGGLGGLVFWGELAAASVLLALWLSRRVSRRVAWLLGAPLVMALLWGAFAAADRFLPSTL